MEKIKSDMVIADIVRENSEVIEVFLEYGLHCVGCRISDVETLEQGAMRHGMKPDEIKMMVSDANKIIERENKLKEKYND